jgi:hypothetical protein
MPTCHEMKKGEIYTCPNCKMEMQVIKECCDSSEVPPGAGCFQDSSPENTLACCGVEMQQKHAPNCGCS